MVAERAGISRATLCSIEKGAPSVAKDDELGRKLQDLGLPVRKRVAKKERKRSEK